MVIDTSALLAVFFHEKNAIWVKDQLLLNPFNLKMSTVNLAELLILLQNRQPHLFEAIRDEILGSTIHFVPPSVSQAERAAWARDKFPLNLGDCFAYALAKEEKAPLLTLDADFKKTDLEVLLP